MFSLLLPFFMAYLSSHTGSIHLFTQKHPIMGCFCSGDDELHHFFRVILGQELEHVPATLSAGALGRVAPLLLGHLGVLHILHCWLLFGIATMHAECLHGGKWLLMTGFSIAYFAHARYGMGIC